eukprot:CAMPEP_0115686778 /NCGR_PEP_ID=MMETSP0272-20121206/60138_1 /TAXON_ID=71861 /ORGANISM="Scrippsiella trochoidea, Strain CCMP3099" /LENGTH=78 /DNA_ID=CAMNT_0003126381 /DNA_START=96 /DNA_END=329 /DNA_ORIENTATION=-
MKSSFRSVEAFSTFRSEPKVPEVCCALPVLVAVAAVDFGRQPPVRTAVRTKPAAKARVAGASRKAATSAASRAAGGAR